MDGNCGHSTFSEEFVCKTEKAFICKPKSDLDSDICNVTTHSKYSTSDLPALKGCEMKLEFEGEHLEPKYSSYDNILTNIKSEPTDLPEIIDIPQLVGQLADQKTPVVAGIKQEIFPTIIKVEIEKSNFDEKINQEDIGFNEGFKLEHEEVNLTDVKNKVDLDEGPSFSDENPKFSTTENNFRCNNLGISMKAGQNSNTQDCLYYECNDCGVTFLRKRNLIYHIRTVHMDLKIYQQYKCRFCDYSNILHYPVKIHEKRYHLSGDAGKPFKCSQCPFETKYRASLRYHKHTHRNPGLSETIYKCDSCDYNTPFSHCLKRHILVHKSEAEVRMFKCSFCSYKSKYKFSITKHEKRHIKSAGQLGNPYIHQCSLCSLSSRNEKHLTKHMKCHENPNDKIVLFKCSNCHYKTTEKRDLAKHSAIHKSEDEIKMYDCNLCTYRTKKKANLRRHLESHKRNGGIHKCNECDYQALKKGHLTKHKLTHIDKM